MMINKKYLMFGMGMFALGLMIGMIDYTKGEPLQYWLDDISEYVYYKQVLPLDLQTTLLNTQGIISIEIEDPGYTFVRFNSTLNEDIFEELSGIKDTIKDYKKNKKAVQDYLMPYDCVPAYDDTDTMVGLYVSKNKKWEMIVNDTKCLELVG